MLRVGYPESLMPELLRDFPPEIELIAISDKLDRDIEIEVWIPDPYATRALRAWPHLHGVRLVLSMLAGTEWIPAAVGPHVTICNAHGAHNVPTAEWTLAAIRPCSNTSRSISTFSTPAFGTALRGRRGLR